MRVGIYGEQGAGKDSVARLLKNLDKETYEIVAFGDSLRSLVEASHSVVQHEGRIVKISSLVDTLGWDEAKRINPEIRRTLQNVGTSVRLIDKDHWVRAYRHKTKEDKKIFLTPDCRFPNEFDQMTIIVRVVRDNNPFYQHNHHSESFLDSVRPHLIVDNDGDIMDLTRKAEQLHKRIKNWSYR